MQCYNSYYFNNIPECFILITCKLLYICSIYNDNLFYNNNEFFFSRKSETLTEHGEDPSGGPPGMELLQHLQGDTTTIVEKERKLSEMILQLQLFREQLLTQQDHPNKVRFYMYIVFT